MFSGSALGWPGIIIPFSMFLANFSVPLTCSSEHQFDSAAPMISVSRMRWSASSNQSLQTSLLLSSVYRNTVVDKAEGSTCSKVMCYCQTGWPEKQNLELPLSPFWNARGSLTIHDDLLLYNGHIVAPFSLQKETLNRLHEGHQGIVRCRTRTKTSVWWPGIASQVSEMIKRCPECMHSQS